MRETAIVAWGVVRDALHRKVFYGVLAFTVILILLVPMLPSAELGIQVDLMREAALGLASIMAFLLAAILGATILPSEMQRRSVYNVLSRPLRRWQYYLGKYLGLLLVVALSLLLVYVVMLVLVYAKFSILNPALAKALFTIFLEAALLGSVAMLASVRLSPLVCVFITALFYVVGHVKGDFLYQAMNEAGNGPFIRGLAGFFYYLLPNLERLNINETIAHGERVFRVGVGEMALLLGMTLGFTVVFLALGIRILEEKDL